MGFIWDIPILSFAYSGSNIGIRGLCIQYTPEANGGVSGSKEP